MTLGAPATPPMVVTDGAEWIGIFRQTAPGLRSQIALVLLTVAAAQFHTAPAFLILDPPAAPPMLEADRTDGIDVIGQASPGFGSQIALILLTMRVARCCVRHSSPPGRWHMRESDCQRSEQLRARSRKGLEDNKSRSNRSILKRSRMD